MIQVTWYDEECKEVVQKFESFAQAAEVMEELTNNEVPFAVTYE